MHSMLSKPEFYITLVRGIPGTRRLHRRALEASRLGKCNQTFMRWNTPTVRDDPTGIVSTRNDS